MPRSSDVEANPAAVHQSKFRVVPKKSYSERMSETRAEIRRIMKDALRRFLRYSSKSPTTYECRRGDYAGRERIHAMAQLLERHRREVPSRHSRLAT